jgi:adhesin transport system membrane fusion protein
VIKLKTFLSGLWNKLRRSEDEAVFDADDVNYMSSTHAVMVQTTPSGARVIIWVVLLFIIIAIIWASLATLDEITRGSGKVIPSGQVQVIQNLEGGIVSELGVQEGQVVNKGDVLLRIDNTRFMSSLRENTQHYLSLKAKNARLKAETEGLPFEIPADALTEYPELVEQERDLYESRQKELDTSREILKQQIAQRRQDLASFTAKLKQNKRSYALLDKELSMTRPLVAQGVMSEVEMLRLERQANDLKGEISSLEISMLREQSRLEEALKKLEEAEINFKNLAHVELNETSAELRRLVETNMALEDRVKRTTVTSPVRGTVKRLLVNTIGGVVQPGSDLVEIVPLEDNLLIEAKVRPSDIAFLSPGLKAIVKVTAYDFSIYGGLEASVERISADTITDDDGESFYIVRVRTNQSYIDTPHAPLPIIPGMLTEVNILTGKKTVLEYLLKPILRARERAMRER